MTNLEESLLLTQFHTLGYYLIKEAIPKNKIFKIKKNIVRIYSEQIPPYRKDSDEKLLRISDIYSRENNTIFYSLYTLKLQTILKALLGQNIVLVLNRHNHAAPNLKGQTFLRYHRDVLQWSRPIITAIVYLEKSTIKTGCTWIIPGTQTLPTNRIPNNGGMWLDSHPEYCSLSEQGLPVIATEGDILLMNSMTFHSVGQNISKSSRWSIIFGFRSYDELEPNGGKFSKLVDGLNIYKGNELGDYPMSDRRNT